MSQSSDGTERRVCIDGKQRLTSIQKYARCLFYSVQVTFNIILVFSDLWMAWCVFLGLCPAYVLISNPLHRYTVCIPPEFRAQLANAPLSRVQIKTSEIGVISF